ncbi:MAG: 3-deoxy-7-phosphoheptulonate synthase [Kiritimatiellae bacterium]|jgi:3-deoxy-7-phosphoheptulonate synthase|nr:3-deoxy-7-phosphoheptulonate synthase [Kiritimatiellia bacterium]
MKYEKEQRGDTGCLVKAGNVCFGGKQLVLIAGPCAIESREFMLETATAVKEAGATMLRGGAFKPRTSPYEFQGLSFKGLEYLAEARELTGLPVVTEVMDTVDIAAVAEVADMVQVGSRNMHNYALLKSVGECGKPVLLKRGMCATIREFLCAAEYVLQGGCNDLVLCVRGIRTFEEEVRFTMDLAAVPLLKEQSWMPVMVDPSHGTGKLSLVPSMARAAVACGADGVMMEVHCHADQALCDGQQSASPEDFSKMVGEMRLVAEAVGRTV